MPPDLAEVVADAPAVETPAAPAPAAPAAPAAPDPERSRKDTVREAVAAVREKAASVEGRNPNAPAKVAAPAAERPRAPDGKFAPGIDRPAPAAKPGAQQQGVAVQPSSSADLQAAVGDGTAKEPGEAAPAPPPGWSPASKVAFDHLPDSVKADIAKREKEVNQGFAKLAEYKPVDKYLDMAKRGGTTLDKALENYTGMEQLLRRDVFAGFEAIAKNTGVNLRSFAVAYLQRSGGLQNGQAPNDPAARQPAPIDPDAIVRQATAAVRSEYEQRQAKDELERFRTDPKNRFFENVRPQMLRLVEAGFAQSFQDAYDQACRLDPEISRLLNTPTPPDPRIQAAAQAKAAAKATTGAPTSGLPDPTAKPAATTREAIRAAVLSQRGARA